MANGLGRKPYYSGKVLRSIVNEMAFDLGLTWEDNAEELSRLVDAVASDLDRLGPLAILVPVRPTPNA